MAKYNIRSKDQKGTTNANNKGEERVPGVQNPGEGIERSGPRNRRGRARMVTNHFDHNVSVVDSEIYCSDCEITLEGKV